MSEDFHESISLVLDRKRKFNSLIDTKHDLGELGASFTCPSCGYPTLSERGGYEICILCSWEDNGQDNENADEVWGGPNHELSLNDNRVLFETNKKSNWTESGREQWFAPVRKRIIDCFERILVETTPVKRAAISKELPALWEECSAILRYTM